MRLINPLILLTPLALLHHVSAAAQLYSTWMADSMIAHGVTATRWYDVATFHRSIEMVYNATSSPTYLKYLISQIDAILHTNGSIKDWDLTDHQLDNIRVGAVILNLYTLNPLPKYKTALDFLHDQLVNKQKRTPSGGYWHKDPKYPNQMWLDGLYMAEPFSAAYTSLFEAKNTSAWDNIILQFDLVEKHCRNQTTGMLYHGYDESLKAVWADPKTGASPRVWDRAQGWYLMALVDVLDWFPTGHPGYAKLRGYLDTLAKALKTAQDVKSGGWWLVMDAPYPGMEGNYIESSGTAMYTYGLLKGVRKGYLSGDVVEGYGKVAERAYGLMTERFVARNGTNGTLNWEGTVRVGSLDGNGDFKYYTTVPIVENSLLGLSPFVMASVEMEAYIKAKGV
ncbi:glycosyl hydrolase [Bombardia bombarda]|uniref:Glycosyl hydrolase n=1 Tax=Bombardia bombarda TaxID=252184 RepID=A0AA39U485_9PEZI|nr:glycosyl hydrolase [Bombardia bombarda]